MILSNRHTVSVDWGKLGSAEPPSYDQLMSALDATSSPSLPSTSASSPSSTTTVRMQLRCGALETGESLCVVGESDLLGNWKWCDCVFVSFLIMRRRCDETRQQFQVGWRRADERRRQVQRVALVPCRSVWTLALFFPNAVEIDVVSNKAARMSTSLSNALRTAMWYAMLCSLKQK